MVDYLLFCCCSSLALGEGKQFTPPREARVSVHAGVWTRPQRLSSTITSARVLWEIDTPTEFSFVDQDSLENNRMLPSTIFMYIFVMVLTYSDFMLQVLVSLKIFFFPLFLFLTATDVDKQNMNHLSGRVTSSRTRCNCQCMNSHLLMWTGTLYQCVEEIRRPEIMFILLSTYGLF